MVETMTPKDAWLYAATWGSAMTSGDPGACMYGFDESCRPQSEEHRQDVIGWMEGCRQNVVDNPNDYDTDELATLDAFVAFIKERGIEGQDRPPFIIELSYCGSVTVCKMDGEMIDGDALNDLMDCTGSGDAEGPCQYVLEHHKPEFRIVKKVDGEYKNVLADADDKRKVCEELYGDSDTDFTDEDNANLYIVWEAAHSVEREQDDEE